MGMGMIREEMKNVSKNTLYISGLKKKKNSPKKLSLMFLGLDFPWGGHVYCKKKTLGELQFFFAR